MQRRPADEEQCGDRAASDGSTRGRHHQQPRQPQQAQPPTAHDTHAAARIARGGAAARRFILCCSAALVLCVAGGGLLRVHRRFEPSWVEVHGGFGSHSWLTPSHLWKNAARLAARAPRTGCLQLGGDAPLPLRDPLFAEVAEFAPSSDPIHARSSGPAADALYRDTLRMLNRKGLRRLIVWGLDPSHDSPHTHAYIHHAWFRALVDLAARDRQTAWDVCWFDETSQVSAADLRDSIVFTSPEHGGWISEGIPAGVGEQENTYFVLHGSAGRGDTKPLLEHIRAHPRRTVFWLVHYHPQKVAGVRADGRAYQSWNNASRTLHMPWAADLTPWEIEANKQRRIAKLRGSRRAAPGDAGGGGNIVFVGTIWKSNAMIMPRVARAAAKLGLTFTHHGDVWDIDPDLRAELLGSPGYVRGKHARSSLAAAQVMENATFAPAVMGPGQHRIGYVPCRIFKTIAAGSLGVTNSPVLKLLFEDGNERGAPAPIIAQTALHHDANFTDLFSSALRVMRDGDAAADFIARGMDTVRDQHTYLARLSLAMRKVLGADGGS